MALQAVAGPGGHQPAALRPSVGVALIRAWCGAPGSLAGPPAGDSPRVHPARRGGPRVSYLHL